MWEILFWLSIFAIVYTYAGYPLLVWGFSLRFQRPVQKAPITPGVSVIIACHNEARTIESRLANLLESEYPAGLTEIIVISDGSTDGTADIARRFPRETVRVLELPLRKGKAAALNAGVEVATGEVIVFGDARQRFEPEAIRHLVANFADPTVGAVSGELFLDGAEGIGEGVGLYWRYEKWIRRNESRGGSVIGATGAIYAIRRAYWRALPPGTILDDVYTPMQIALRGGRVVFEEGARAHDTATYSAGREFARKVRTLAGNYQLCQLMPRLLLPTKALLFQFYSHKLMRLAAPMCLVLLLVANVSLVAQGESGRLFYGAALGAQTLFYASVCAGAYLLRRQRKVRLLNFAYAFSMMNAAALVGLVYFILGKRDIWAR